MTKVEEAKAALWGQLVDSGELGEDDANVLLDNLVDAARTEGAERGLNVAQRWIDSEFSQGRHIISLRKSDLLAAILSSPANALPIVYGDSLPIKEEK